jgi:hypothetical protein
MDPAIDQGIYHRDAEGGGMLMIPNRVTKRWLKSLPFESLQVLEQLLFSVQRRAPTRTNYRRWLNANFELNRRAYKPIPPKPDDAFMPPPIWWPVTQ